MMPPAPGEWKAAAKKASAKVTLGGGMIFSSCIGWVVVVAAAAVKRPNASG